MVKSRTRKPKAQAKRLAEFLRELNTRERSQRERQNAENGAVLEPVLYPSEFFEYYGDPINRSSLQDIAWRERWNARYYPNDPRHLRGTSMNQKRKLAAHRERFFPTLKNIHRLGRARRQTNKTRQSRAAVIEELKYLPPIEEMGYPGGNVYRAAEENWKEKVAFE